MTQEQPNPTEAWAREKHAAERAYVTGQRSAWLGLLHQAMRALGAGDAHLEKSQLVIKIEEARAGLVQLCERLHIQDPQFGYADEPMSLGRMVALIEMQILEANALAEVSQVMRLSQLEQAVTTAIFSAAPLAIEDVHALFEEACSHENPAEEMQARPLSVLEQVLMLNPAALHELLARVSPAQLSLFIEGSRIVEAAGTLQTMVADYFRVSRTPEPAGMAAMRKLVETSIRAWTKVIEVRGIVHAGVDMAAEEDPK